MKSIAGELIVTLATITTPCSSCYPLLSCPKKMVMQGRASPKVFSDFGNQGLFYFRLGWEFINEDAHCLNTMAPPICHRLFPVFLLTTLDETQLIVTKKQLKGKGCNKIEKKSSTGG